MEIKVPTPEEINQQITEAIAASAIGEELTKQVEKSVEALSRSWDNPYKSIVENAIRGEIQMLVTKEFGDVIREKIREQLDDEKISTLVSGLFAAVDKMNRGY